MSEVAQPADDTPIARRVHLCSSAVLAQLQLLLHRSHAWLALCHAAALQQLLRVGALTQGDALLPLPHLDAEVLGERAEITHLETSRHLTLETVDALR